MIEKDLYIDDNNFFIRLNNINKTINLEGENWGNIKGDITIDSLSFDFIIFGLSDSEHREIQEHFWDVETLSEFQEKMRIAKFDITAMGKDDQPKKDTASFGIDVLINIDHDSVWSIYNDKTFEKVASELIGVDVTFTEQGLQLDGRASMEVV